jgi:hypothetical protein
LVLYLTKMMPIDGDRLVEKKQTSSPLSMQEKPEQALTPSAAPSPVFKDGVRERGSGSTLSKPWLSGRGVEGLTQQ